MTRRPCTCGTGNTDPAGPRTSPLDEGHHTYYDAATRTEGGGSGGRMLDLDKLRDVLSRLATGGRYTVAVRCCCGWTTGYGKRRGYVAHPAGTLADVPALVADTAAHVSGEPGDLLDLLGSGDET